jgi:hypothetical protein
MHATKVRYLSASAFWRCSTRFWRYSTRDVTLWCAQGAMAVEEEEEEGVEERGGQGKGDKGRDMGEEEEEGEPSTLATVLGAYDVRTLPGPSLRRLLSTPTHPTRPCV